MVSDLDKAKMYLNRSEKARCPHCNEVLDNYDQDELEASYGYRGLECVREAVKYELDR